MTTRHTTTLSVDALISLREDVRIIDCRARLGDPGFGIRVFAEGHIPGAVQGDLDRDFAAPPGRAGRHPLPDAATLLESCRAWGIEDSTPVVVYDDMGGLFAARAWWLLRWLGHETVAVLDGGLRAWTDAGHPLETQLNPYPRGAFSRRAPLTREIDAATLLSDPPAQLVDARAEERWAGIKEPIDHTAGHIPGAACLPATGNLDSNQRFLTPGELRARFAGVTPDDVVCYCGSGVTAAHNILAMRMAGFPEPRLYPGSWSEWIEDPARPVATATPQSS